MCHSSNSSWVLYPSQYLARMLPLVIMLHRSTILIRQYRSATESRGNKYTSLQGPNSIASRVISLATRLFSQQSMQKPDCYFSPHTMPLLYGLSVTIEHYEELNQSLKRCGVLFRASNNMIMKPCLDA